MCVRDSGRARDRHVSYQPANEGENSMTGTRQRVLIGALWLTFGMIPIRVLAAPGISFQGRLEYPNPGSFPSGEFDFEFALYAASSGGSAINGITLTYDGAMGHPPSATVTNGLFLFPDANHG